MSRSYRKSPCRGFCADSDKKGKQLANRKLRSKVRNILHYRYREEDLILPVMREISDLWDMAKDGKMGYWTATDEERSDSWYRKYLAK